MNAVSINVMLIVAIIIIIMLVTNVIYWLMQAQEEVPQVRQRPRAAKSTTQVWLPILVRLAVFISAAFGSWRSYESLPMMQLYHHQIDHGLGNTGEQPSAGWCFSMFNLHCIFSVTSSSCSYWIALSHVLGNH